MTQKSLNDYVDDFVRGTFYVLADFFRSGYLMVRYPFRGYLLVNARLQKDNQVFIRSRLFIFIAYLLFFSLSIFIPMIHRANIANPAHSDPDSYRINYIFAELYSPYSISLFFPVLIVCFLSVIIMELNCRFISTVFFPKRTDAFIDSFLFVAGFQILVIALVTLTLMAAAEQKDFAQFDSRAFALRTILEAPISTVQYIAGAKHTWPNSFYSLYLMVALLTTLAVQYPVVRFFAQDATGIRARWARTSSLFVVTTVTALAITLIMSNVVDLIGSRRNLYFSINEVECEYHEQSTHLVRSTFTINNNRNRIIRVDRFALAIESDNPNYGAAQISRPGARQTTFVVRSLGSPRFEHASIPLANGMLLAEAGKTYLFTAAIRLDPDIVAFMRQNTKNRRCIVTFTIDDMTLQGSGNFVPAPKPPPSPAT